MNTSIDPSQMLTSISSIGSTVSAMIVIAFGGCFILSIYRAFLVMKGK